MVVNLGLLRRMLRQKCQHCGQRLYKYALTWKPWRITYYVCPDVTACLARQTKQQDRENERQRNAVAEELAERAKREGS